MLLFKILFLSTYLMYGSAQPIKQDTIYKNHCLNTEEMKLYNLINDYRKENKLPPIPLSKSLSYVARQHTIDLYSNVKGLSHGWSTCIYNASKKETYTCMWLKPSEMTNYKGYGYECAYSVDWGDVGAEDALNTWKKSTPHNNVITNKSIWSTSKWNALGVGIYKNYATIWFGEDKDEENTPEICK